MIYVELIPPVFSSATFSNDINSDYSLDDDYLSSFAILLAKLPLSYDAKT